MEGLELAQVLLPKKPLFVGDVDAKFKIAALDIGIKEYF